MRAETLRFLASFLLGRGGAKHDREALIEMGGQPRRSATLYESVRGGEPAAAWILLHGVTIPGRHHAAVRRTGRALSAAGFFAVAPEIPSWTQLRVQASETGPAIDSGLAAIREHVPGPTPVGVIGFSVAGTWALQDAAARDGSEIAAVASFGGYGDTASMLRGMVAGEYEEDGVRHHYRPDPYGRWIMGANLLPELESGEFGTSAERALAAEALHRLATTAGRHGAKAGLPVYDPLIGELRATLPAGALRAWDILAPRADARRRPRAEALALAGAMASAALARHPELDPAGRLGKLAAPAALLHGRSDRLIPFTETERLAGLLPPELPRRVVISQLIGHTKPGEAAALFNPVTLAREVRNFAGMMRFLFESAGRAG